MTPRHLKPNSSPNWLSILTIASFGLNLILVCIITLRGAGQTNVDNATPSVESVSSPSVRGFSLNHVDATSVGSAAAASQQLSEELLTWKASHANIRSQFETLKERYIKLQEAHIQLREEARKAKASGQSSSAPSALSTATLKELEQCRQNLRLVEDKMHSLPSASSSSVSNGVCPPCDKFLDQSRLRPSDLSLAPFDPREHEVTWNCEAAVTGHSNETLQWCSEESTNEQYFQLSFFDRPGAGSRAAVRRPKPQSPKCTQLPPPNYVFPKKVQSMPLAEGEKAVNWENLRVKKLEDLLVFNQGTPKNLYHFNASFYDYEQEQILDVAAKYIPFGHKVRLMLDVGSGGGSLGLLLKRRYDIQTVSTVFADWPYCEYITERGNICMYIDAMEAMPFSKFSYDVVHSSWVFHALFNHQLRAAFLEQNRILRPGGYMWIFGGWAMEQVETIHHLLVDQLGYKYLMNEKRMIDRTKVKHTFDNIPYELDWTAILVKPIRADEGTCKRVYQ